MEVKCTIRANGNDTINDETDGNMFLNVQNSTGYHNVKLTVDKYQNLVRETLATIEIDGNTLIKAVNNAMND